MQRKERLKQLQNSLKKLQEELIFDEEKPLDEIVEILKPYKKVAIIGCSTTL